MRQVVLFFLLSAFLAVLAQDQISPFVPVPNTCATIDEYVGDNDFLDKDGEIVTLGVISALVPLHYSDDTMLNLIYSSKYSFHYYYVIYSRYVFVDGVLQDPEDVAAKFFYANNGKFFSKARNSQDRFYPIDITTEAGQKVFERWLRASSIEHFAGNRDTSDWKWFRENAKFKITVRQTADSEQIVIFDRIFPKYFVEVLD